MESNSNVFLFMQSGQFFMIWISLFTYGFTHVGVFLRTQPFLYIFPEMAHTHEIPCL